MTVQLAGAGPVPAAGVATVDLVVGAVPGAAAGSVTVWPAGTDRPARTTVTFDAGTPASARATVRLGSGGAVALAVDGGPTDVTFDVAGYAPTPNPPSARFASGPIHGAGFMTVVAELPSGRLVAGGDSQGFFVSDDGGRTWLSRNVLRGGADPFASRGVASILVAPVSGPNGSVPTLFAAVGKRDQPTAAMLRSDDGGETWVVDNGGKGIWFDGGNLPGASTPAAAPRAGSSPSPTAARTPRTAASSPAT